MDEDREAKGTFFRQYVKPMAPNRVAMVTPYRTTLSIPGLMNKGIVVLYG